MNTTEERFFSKVNMFADNGCWEWMGKLCSWGYGAWQQKRVYKADGTFTRKTLRAHRWAYEFFKEKIPRGLLILHTCDNPCCVNPKHLYAGTDADNTRDKMDRGRHFQQAQTHCKHGHEFTVDNTYIYLRAKTGNSRRVCKICTCKRAKERRLRIQK